MCPPSIDRNALMQLAMASSLLERSRHSRNALVDLAPITPPTRNALADLVLAGMMGSRSSANGMFGNPSPFGFGSPPGASSLLGGLATKTRFTFYSFHYADVMRVNQIRKCDQFKTTDQWRPRVVDRSLWETAKKTNAAALASMIDKALVGTSTTCVLAGTETWSREWVRHEIARSLQRGNGLLTVFIHNCPCPNNGRAPLGYNPLDCVALGWDMRIYEWDSVSWKPHGRVTEKLTSWPKWLPQAAPGYLTQLSAGAASYDWVADDGARNLIHWTDAAAAAAGK